MHVADVTHGKVCDFGNTFDWMKKWCGFNFFFLSQTSSIVKAKLLFNTEGKTALTLLPIGVYNYTSITAADRLLITIIHH